jgi:hypothetical protein
MTTQASEEVEARRSIRTFIVRSPTDTSLVNIPQVIHYKTSVTAFISSQSSATYSICNLLILSLSAPSPPRKSRNAHAISRSRRSREHWLRQCAGLSRKLAPGETRRVYVQTRHPLLDLSKPILTSSSTRTLSYAQHASKPRLLAPRRSQLYTARRQTRSLHGPQHRRRHFGTIVQLRTHDKPGSERYNMGPRYARQP